MKTLSILILLAGATFALANDSVLVLGNSNVANTIEVYDVSAAGNLTFRQSVATGGVGRMGSIGSQGVIAYDRETFTVAACNPGNHTVSIFSLRKGTLMLRQVLSTGGFRPVSVALRRNLMLVLNQGDATHESSVKAFSISWPGATALPHTYPLSAGGYVNPAQVGISPDGTWFAVAEKNRDKIDIFDIDAMGTPLQRTVIQSVGPEPFGFLFDRAGRLHVSEAFNAATGQSALTSYQRVSGGLIPITASAKTLGTSACWVALTPDGRFAFTTNTGSRTISTFSVGTNGALALVSNVPQMAGAAPIDEDVSVGGRFLHVLNNGINAVRTYAIAANGVLTQIDQDPSPLGAVGLIVVPEPTRRSVLQ